MHDHPQVFVQAPGQRPGDGGQIAGQEDQARVIEQVVEGSQFPGHRKAARVEDHAEEASPGRGRGQGGPRQVAGADAEDDHRFRGAHPGGRHHLPRLGPGAVSAEWKESAGARGGGEVEDQFPVEAPGDLGPGSRGETATWALDHHGQSITRPPKLSRRSTR
ncbi:MAG: hypothetical protein Q9Q13_05555 [Acidobacteriota bacterium]|nr:hypothetical protein [Acidobacteriota bacterium]